MCTRRAISTRKWQQKNKSEAHKKRQCYLTEMENQIQFTKKKISLIFVIKIVTQEIACSANDLAPEDTLASSSPLLSPPTVSTE